MRYVYCHPLFDERKCSHRFSYQLKKSFQQKGVNLERFDYRGTGEARGQFSNVTWDTLREDIRRFVDDDNLSLIGLRLGGTLALDYCLQYHENVKNLVLIEPIIIGADYAQYLRRKQHIKDLMTAGSSAELNEKGFENIEGFKTSSRLIKQIQKINLLEQPKNTVLKTRIIVIHISNRKRPVNTLEHFLKILSNITTEVSIQTVNSPVFWERLPNADYNKITKRVCKWSDD